MSEDKTLLHEWPAHDSRGVPVVYRFYVQTISGEPFYSVHAVGDTKWMTHGQAFRAIAGELERLIKEKSIRWSRRDMLMFEVSLCAWDSEGGYIHYLRHFGELEEDDYELEDIVKLRNRLREVLSEEGEGE